MNEILKNKIVKRSRINKKGFTLVELLVSATIILLCIVAIVAMLRKGRDIDINDRYRRNARAIVVSEFENPQYAYIRYQTLKAKADPNGFESERTNVVIDSLPGGNVLTGTLTTSIGAERTETASDGTTNVPYIPLTIKMEWSTIDGDDNITITKYISQ